MLLEIKSPSLRSSLYFRVLIQTIKTFFLSIIITIGFIEAYADEELDANFSISGTSLFESDVPENWIDENEDGEYKFKKNIKAVSYNDDALQFEYFRTERNHVIVLRLNSYYKTTSSVFYLNLAEKLPLNLGDFNDGNGDYEIGVEVTVHKWPDIHLRKETKNNIEAFHDLKMTGQAILEEAEKNWTPARNATVDDLYEIDINFNSKVYQGEKLRLYSDETVKLEYWRAKDFNYWEPLNEGKHIYSLELRSQNNSHRSRYYFPNEYKLPQEIMSKTYGDDSFAELSVFIKQWPKFQEKEDVEIEENTKKEKLFFCPKRVQLSYFSILFNRRQELPLERTSEDLEPLQQRDMRKIETLGGYLKRGTNFILHQNAANQYAHKCIYKSHGSVQNPSSLKLVYSKLKSLFSFELTVDFPKVENNKKLKIVHNQIIIKGKTRVRSIEDDFYHYDSDEFHLPTLNEESELFSNFESTKKADFAGTELREIQFKKLGTLSAHEIDIIADKRHPNFIEIEEILKKLDIQFTQEGKNFGSYQGLVQIKELGLKKILDEEKEVSEQSYNQKHYSVHGRSARAGNMMTHEEIESLTQCVQKVDCEVYRVLSFSNKGYQSSLMSRYYIFYKPSDKSYSLFVHYLGRD